MAAQPPYLSISSVDRDVDPLKSYGLLDFQKAPKFNIVGLVGLISAVVGTLLSFAPELRYFGWMLLLVALVLGIIAVSLKEYAKILGIMATAFAFIGSITAAFALAVTSVQPAPTASATGATAVQSSVAQIADVSGDFTTPAASASGGKGTRQAPLPIGSRISWPDWDVTINSVDLDATAEILAANSFNKAPAAGQTYMMVNVTMTYTGNDGQGQNPTPLIFFVAPSGNSFDTWNSGTLPPDFFDYGSPLYEGASTTGNIMLAVPADGVSSGVLTVQVGFGDKAFVAVQ